MRSCASPIKFALFVVAANLASCHGNPTDDGFDAKEHGGASTPRNKAKPSSVGGSSNIIGGGSAAADNRAAGGLSAQGSSNTSSSSSNAGGASSVDSSNSLGGTSTTSFATTQEVSSVCGTSPFILTTGQVPNARDLGGIAIADGGLTRCRNLFRGSYLSTMTASGCEEYATLGIKTVIDLRDATEQVDRAPACVLERSNVISAPMATPISVGPDGYLTALYTKESVPKALEVLADDSAYPVYFHCRYGRDRSGVLAAVILLALGASRDDVMREYMLSEQAGMSAFPDSMIAVLDEIERVGGILPYLDGMGVSRETVEALRSNLRSLDQAP